MGDRMIGIPLAFALAFLASESDANPLQSQGQNELLVPGSLRGLFQQADAANASTAAGPDVRSKSIRIAQWFNNNWANCYSGNWRRC
jgi:hypothetical protein